MKSHVSHVSHETYLLRPLRVGSTQSLAHCLLVQLLQGRPITAASHLVLRTRQGTQALLAFMTRFPTSPVILWGSPPEGFIGAGEVRFGVR